MNTLSKHAAKVEKIKKWIAKARKSYKKLSYDIGRYYGAFLKQKASKQKKGDLESKYDNDTN